MVVVVRKYKNFLIIKSAIHPLQNQNKAHTDIFVIILAGYSETFSLYLLLLLLLSVSQRNSIKKNSNNNNNNYKLILFIESNQKINIFTMADLLLQNTNIFANACTYIYIYIC